LILLLCAYEGLGLRILAHMTIQPSLHLSATFGATRPATQDEDCHHLCPIHGTECLGRVLWKDLWGWPGIGHGEFSASGTGQKDDLSANDGWMHQFARGRFQCKLPRALTPVR